ncbi:hypothetical protein GJ700_13400 [Duganella sp. FT92W]|uniref:Uncharacterized protein n=1 Tax=Pseudoduganella rivuli TaxID=2666085 RepID=A0A7X2LUB7_9BURK|nr:hypothetical protein [Pseudoduganella rivuli]MRV72704.1 hypothetical protein [Pseudoduganella rivuli]
MEKLNSELARLYLPSGAVSEDALQAHMAGLAPLALADANGGVRAAALSFPVMRDHGEGHHWSRLCDVANELQTRFGLPAPAVSVSGDDGYCLWLSLEQPVTEAEMRALVASLRAAVMPDIPAVDAEVPLPPCQHPDTERWSAFIHPGMGASFADGSGLEIAPPLAGQAAFIEGLHSISAGQFADLWGQLRGSAPAPAPVRSVAPAGLLLKDATLEEIVQYLHSKNIEPTFRFLK